MEKTVSENPAKEKEGTGNILKKIEAVVFPLLAALIGIGYTVAILVNNPFDRVIHSPHAIILMVIFLSIAYFPMRSLYGQFRDTGDNEE